MTDVVVRLDGPMRARTDSPARIVHARGGSGANVAVAAVRAGVAARFVGRVGSDDRGQSLVVALERLGVEARVESGGATGTVVVLVDEQGERSFLTDRAAATELTLSRIGPASELLDGVSWLHVPGYSLADGSTAASAETMVLTARRRSIGVSISTSSVSMIEALGTDRFRELLEHLRPDILVANGDEAALLELEPRGSGGAGATIVTHGAGPTCLYREGVLVHELVPPAAPDVADTTGAGDAFTGGLLAALIGGRTELDAMEAGHRMAALALTLPGAELDDGAVV